MSTYNVPVAIEVTSRYGYLPEAKKNLKKNEAYNIIYLQTTVVHINIINYTYYLLYRFDGRKGGRDKSNFYAQFILYYYIIIYYNIIIKVFKIKQQHKRYFSNHNFRTFKSPIHSSIIHRN